MATNPPPASGTSRWSLGNWTSGPVTFFNALGLGKWNIKIPKLSAQLPSQVAANTSTGPTGSPAPPSGPLPASSPGGVVPTSASESAFWVAVLKTIGAPTSQANINSLQAWSQKESIWPGGPNMGGKYNPLNTTLGQPGATNYNSVGVKNFNSPAQGVTATVQTLLGGYPGIVSALKTGNGVCGSGLSGEFNKWSGGGYQSVC